MPWRIGGIGRDKDARDVAQETSLRAFRALPGFKGQAKFSSWLYRIALNLCRDWIRRKRTPLVKMPEGTALGDVRSDIGLWVPPDVELDFQNVKKSQLEGTVLVERRAGLGAGGGRDPHARGGRAPQQ